MYKFANLPGQEKRDYFVATGDKTDTPLPPYLIEKDFWVCFLLDVIFDDPNLKNGFVFKGGTSLSKVFHVIERFSEDVDLSLEPLFWKIMDEEDIEKVLSPQISKSQLEKRKKMVEVKCIEKCKEEILLMLETKVSNLLGSREEPYFVYDEVTPRSIPTIEFRYPRVESSTFSQAGLIKRVVTLELGSLVDQRPRERYPVKSLVAEKFPAAFSKTSCEEVLTLEIERTFWEKIAILHSEAQRPLEKPQRKNCFRDYYDIYKIMSSDYRTRVLAASRILDKVVDFNCRFYHNSWIKYDELKIGSLCLVPPPEKIENLKKGKDEMISFFFVAPPNMDALLEEILSIEKTINSLPQN